MAYDKADAHECLIMVHAEHLERPKKIMPLRMLHYKTAMLLDYANTNRDKALPLVVSIAYYHGKRTPYPYSMDIFDLFEDKDLAQTHLLNTKLVDLKQLPLHVLFEHGTLAPVESLLQMAFQKAVHREDYRTFFEALTLYKDKEVVLKTLKIMLYYATNVLKCDKKQFLDDFMQQLPELEGNMQTLAQQWMEEGAEREAPKVREQGRQEGRQEGLQEALQNVAINMLRQDIDIDLIVKTSGLTYDEVNALMQKSQEN